MQFLEELAACSRIRIATRDEMVVIRKHRPRFELPAAFLGDGEQETFQQIELGRRVKECCLYSVPAVTKYTPLSARR